MQLEELKQCSNAAGYCKCSSAALSLDQLLAESSALRLWQRYVREQLNTWLTHDTYELRRCFHWRSRYLCLWKTHPPDRQSCYHHCRKAQAVFQHMFLKFVSCDAAACPWSNTIGLFEWTKQFSAHSELHWASEQRCETFHKHRIYVLCRYVNATLCSWNNETHNVCRCSRANKCFVEMLGIFFYLGTFRRCWI